MKASASISRKNRRPRGRAPATFAATRRQSGAGAPRSLILFDIDGTLVLTGGAGARGMALAFEEVFGIRNAFRGIHMAGRTDAWILTDAAAAHGISADSPELARFRRVYFRVLADEIHKPGSGRKGIMPGVRELLDAIAFDGDAYLALLTGNYEPAAQIKLEYFDLWRYFACGAFGDDAPDRNALPALERVMQNVNSGFASFNIMMVPLEERKISQQELMTRTRQMLRKYQGARISVSGGTDISGASSGGGRGPGAGGGGFNRLNILIQGPDIEQLQQYTLQLMDKIRE